MIAVGGTKNLGMDIGMQILNMILITITIMSIREDGGSMMKEMTVVITINMLIMLRWKMTITLNEQNLNRVIGTETVIRTMIIIAQRGPILENMITRNLSPILFLISLVRYMVFTFVLYLLILNSLSFWLILSRLVLGSY